MSIENWLTKKAIKAIFDKLEKGAITIGGVDKNRDLVIWASQHGRILKKRSKKRSR